jgi:hypothetical protein
MSEKAEIPFRTPRHSGFARVEPPWVPVEPIWEYKELARDLETEGLPGEAELNLMGAEHWELVGVVREEERVRFYFKRERVR